MSRLLRMASSVFNNRIYALKLTLTPIHSTPQAAVASATSPPPALVLEVRTVSIEIARGPPSHLSCMLMHPLFCIRRDVAARGISSLAMVFQRRCMMKRRGSVWGGIVNLECESPSSLPSSPLLHPSSLFHLSFS